MRFHWLPAALLVATLAGCATQVDAPTLAPVPPAAPAATQQGAAQPVVVRDDTFKPYREATTGEIRTGAPPNTMAMTLSARVDRKTRALTTHLKVELFYVAVARRNYDTARDAGSTVLKLEKIAGTTRCRPGDTCTYDEIVLVDLPAAALRSSTAAGYRLKLFARNGAGIEIAIPGPQIAALFEKADPLARPAAVAKKR